MAKRRKKKQREKKRLSKIQFTKILIAVNNFTGLFFIFLSYVLAFMDKIEVAKDLSETVCKEMCAVTLFYCCKSFWETKSEKQNELEEKKLNLEYDDIENERGD